MPKVEEIFAFIAEEGPGEEGIMAAMVPGIGSTPLVCMKQSLMRKFVPLADEISRASGKPYKILRFKLDGEIPVPRPQKN